MIYSRDKRRGFYWFAPAKDPAGFGMPPPVAFDRDVLGDKAAHKVAKQAAMNFYRGANWEGPRIKVYGSDFLAPGYVTSGDGIYFNPSWGPPPGWSKVDLIVSEIVSMMRAHAEEVASEEGKLVAFNKEHLNNLIRVKVVVASYEPDEIFDEHLGAAHHVKDGLEEQLEAATSEAEADALRGHCEEAQARFVRELNRVVEERGLSEMVEEVASRVSDHMGGDPKKAIGSV